MFNLIGKTLGPYRVLEQIGVGGMATVYKAYQPSMDRYVAVKVLPPYLSQDGQFVKRFQREAHAIAKLEHAHILPVYDYGESEGVTYIVMRYISAGTLKEYLARGRISYDDMARIINQIASALDYAHRQGIIHRDVKPNNILVDEQGNTYLTDFGLARMLETTQQITGSGVGVGTPAYMSPEQGKGIKADHRSDIYSLGVILYEMVTGHVPFEAETPMAVVLKHITDPLPLPRAIAPEVSEQVEMVILRALAKEPAHRYQSAGEMAQALNAAVRKANVIESPAGGQRTPEPQPVSAGPVSIFTRVSWLWQKPRGRLAIFGFGALIVALLGLLLSLLPGKIAIVASQTSQTTPSVAVTATLPFASLEVASATVPVAKTTATKRAPTAVPVVPSPTNTALPKPIVSSDLRWEQVHDASLIPLAVNALALDPNNPENVFVGTYGGGIYISHDGGKTWNPSNTGLGKGTVGQLVVHPMDSKIVYAALFDQGGIYKSTDGGMTWQAINAGIDLDQAWNWTGLVYIAPNDVEKIYFADTTSGLYRSIDGGENWDMRSGSCPAVTGLVIDPEDSDHLFAASYNHPEDTCIAGVYESFDAGYTWELLTTPEMRRAPDQWGGDWWHIAADPRDFSILYAGGQLGTYKSVDAGKTWAKVGGYCMWLATTYTGEVYCADGGEVQISRDGGQTWAASGISTQWSNQERFPVAFAPDGQTIYVGNTRVMKSTNGGRSWEKLDWQAMARGRLVIDPSDSTRLFFSTLDTPGQLYLSSNGGQKWRVVLQNINSGSRLSFQPEQGMIYFPASADSGEALYRSQNGLDWKKFAKGQPTHRAWQILPDPQNAQKLWLAGECGTSLMASEDNGQTFVPARGFIDEICQPIMLIDKTGQRIYLAAWNAFYRTKDGGGFWAKRNNIGGIFRAAALDPSNPDVVYLGSTHNGLLKTANGGDSWAKLTGLPVASINDLAIDPLKPSTVYAATDSGLYLSTDAGVSWAIVDKGLGANPIVYAVAVDPNAPTRVYIATPDGIFQMVQP